MKTSTTPEKVNTLVIFDKTKCFEFPVSALPGDVPLSSEKLKAMEKDKPIVFQIPIMPNEIYNIDADLKALLPTATVSNYSTSNLLPIRVGNVNGDHIKLADSNTTLAIYEEKLHVIESESIYLNGSKISNGEYDIQVGDCIWVGEVRIVPHCGYIEFQGTAYTCNLNIATQDPAKYEEFPSYKRPPRQIYREPTDKVELNEPPAEEEQKKGALLKVIIPPLLAGGMMVAMGVLMGRGIMMLMSVGMMVVTLVNSVFTFVSDRKEKKNKKRERIDKDSKYLLHKRK